MAIGDITVLQGDLKAIELLASTIAANSAPSGASAGLDMNIVYGAFGYTPKDMSLVLASTAGSGSMSVSGRMWGFFPTIGSGLWIPNGVGTDSGKGALNEGASIGETGTDIIRHVEPLTLVDHFARLYLEITAIAGTSTAVTAWLVARRAGGGI